MTGRKIFYLSSLVAFPALFFAFYATRVYTSGLPINDMLPGWRTFTFIGTMILFENIYRYSRAVSQRPVLMRDIISTLMHIFVTGNVMRLIFVPVVIFLPEFFFGRTIFFATPDLLGPLWLQAILAILLYSFLRYWVHRIQHIVPFLWELHSYHHRVSDIRASNLLVSHPFDYAFRNVLPPVILAAVGFNPLAILFGVTFISVASTLSHCGAGLRAGPILNYFFVTPEIHRWHHSATVPSGFKFSVNYGVGFILWDRLFKTFYLPMEDGVPAQPERLGHPSGYADEPNYLRFFFAPLGIYKLFPSLRPRPEQQLSE